MVAQTVAIPDTNFRNKLIASYPSVMSGNLLNTAAASVFGPDLIISNSNISDLTGVQYFKSIYKLDASGNQITTIPDISAYSNIQYLYLYNNNLTSLPNLSTLTNLLQLQCHSNNLTSLPSLSTLTNLQELFIWDNSITTLPDISTLTNLQQLILGANPLDSLQDLSPNASLIQLHCYKNNLSQIKGLQNLTKLQMLVCWGNSITDLSGINNNTTLTTLWAFDNNLQILPVLNNKPSLSSVQLINNQLTFTALLPLNTIPSLIDFQYAPQDSTGIYTIESIRSLDSIKLRVHEDTTLNSNVYNWYKNNTFIATTQTGSYAIPISHASDSGLYKVVITNPNLSLLTLYHRPWAINILNCMDLTSAEFSIITNECAQGATISFSNINVPGSVLPYTYSLKSVYGTDSLKNTSPDFSNIVPGNYSFMISDIRNCSVQKQITIPRPPKCDPVIVTSGNSLMNSYFIEQTGIAKIIDIEGVIVKQFAVPAVWDGRTSDGNLADAGYYVITVNDRKLTNITVIR
jgi:internalin A